MHSSRFHDTNECVDMKFVLNFRYVYLLQLLNGHGFKVVKTAERRNYVE